MSEVSVLYLRSRSALWRRVGADTVLAQQHRQGFEQLSPTAAAVWELLDEPRDLRAIVDRLTASFEGDTEEIGKDVRALLDRLVEEGWVGTLSPSDPDPAGDGFDIS